VTSDCFAPIATFASTLTSLDEGFSQKWERDAALPGDRIAALKRFHEASIFTWISLEPTLDGESSRRPRRRLAPLSERMHGAPTLSVARRVDDSESQRGRIIALQGP
jgi:DNA repair photolyase